LTVPPVVVPIDVRTADAELLLTCLGRLGPPARDCIVRACREGYSHDAPSAVPGLARRFETFAVSLEPVDGSSESIPTGSVLYHGEVTCTDGSPPP